MPSYLNAAGKRILVSFAGCKGFATEMLKLMPQELLGMQNALQAIADNAEAILEHLLEGIDPDQLRGALRYCDNHQLVVQSKTNPRANTDYYTVDSESFDFLLEDALADCCYCDLGEKERKRCTRRRAMLTCGVEIKSRDEACPYFTGEIDIDGEGEQKGV